MRSHKEHVEFQLTVPEATAVYLSGSFNDWSVTADPMKKTKSGVWKKEKKLAPGTYEYKFIVDGVWVLDPACDATVGNPHGSRNNVLEVKGAITDAEKKEAYINKLKQKLDKWHADLDKLEAKAAKAKDASRTKYHKQIEVLQSMREDFEQKYVGMRQASGKAWEELRDGVDNAWKSLSKAISSAKSKLK